MSKEITLEVSVKDLPLFRKLLEAVTAAATLSDGAVQTAGGTWVVPDGLMANLNIVLDDCIEFVKEAEEKGELPGELG